MLLCIKAVPVKLRIMHSSVICGSHSCDVPRIVVVFVVVDMMSVVVVGCLVLSVADIPRIRKAICRF